MFELFAKEDIDRKIEKIKIIHNYWKSGQSQPMESGNTDWDRVQDSVRWCRDAFKAAF